MPHSKSFFTKCDRQGEERDDANLPSLTLLPAPHPSLACGLGRSRAGLLCRVHAAFLSSLQPPPRRARSKAVAPAISAASFLAMLLGAARICTTGILNAGPRLPGLCALHDAALLVCLRPARRRASTPCIHMQKWLSRSVGLGTALVLFERDLFCVVVCSCTFCHALHRSRISTVRL